MIYNGSTFSKMNSPQKQPLITPLPEVHIDLPEVPSETPLNKCLIYGKKKKDKTAIKCAKEFACIFAFSFGISIIIVALLNT